MVYHHVSLPFKIVCTSSQCADVICIVAFCSLRHISSLDLGLIIIDMVPEGMFLTC